MDDKDQIMLESFFKQAAQQQIAYGPGSASSLVWCFSSSLVVRWY